MRAAAASHCAVYVAVIGLGFGIAALLGVAPQLGVGAFLFVAAWSWLVGYLNGAKL